MTPEERSRKLIAETLCDRDSIAAAIREAEKAAFRRGLERAASEVEAMGWGISSTVARHIRAIEEEG